MVGNRLRRRDYTIGWICALPIEKTIAVAMLDERHEGLPQNPLDQNNYTLGQIGAHNVVMTCLPMEGVAPAASVAAQMRLAFPNLRFTLMVGIGGGVPSAAHDIRLGDVVVSVPTGTSSGVIQYDYGKTVQDGRFERKGYLNRPPDMLLNVVSKLRAEHPIHGSKSSQFLSEMASRHPNLRRAATYPGAEADWLFEAEYDHPEKEPTCAQCDTSKLVLRPGGRTNGPMIHYGLIASGNQLMKHGQTREKLRKELDVLCFEMEAAGLMNIFHCIVIRGVSDYSDSHKNDIWHEYAAATAGSYAKELLLALSPIDRIELETETDMGVGARSLEENSRAEMMTAVPSPRVGTGSICEGRADTFYSLERISKKPSIKSYWNNLTVEAMIVYEKVYDIARDPHTGLVHFEAFSRQFPQEPPSKSLIATIWKRIDPTMMALLPRNLTLALIYMLHVEANSNMTPNNQPRDATIISSVRRAMLECYGNWVECSCQCGRQWSFANGKQGLWRIVQDGSGKDRDGKSVCCRAARRQECNPVMRWRYKDGTEWIDKNRRRWLEDRQFVKFST